MLQQKVSVTFFLDKSRPNKDGECLIKLNIYCKPDKKRYPTSFHVSKEDWEKLNGQKLRDENLKDIKQKLSILQNSIEKIVYNITPFSFVQFEEIFYNKKKAVKNNSLKSWFEDTIEKLNTNGQIGTASSYKTTLNSLNEFKTNLNLNDVTPNFLNEYEKFMLSKSKSPTTIGIYLRQLRAIFNAAIEEKVISRDLYPFKKYSIPSSRNVKKALNEKQISEILNYKTKDVKKQKSVDFWILSYLCSGINFADIIQLKYSDLNGDYIHFFRQKTIRTKKKDLRPIVIGLNDKAKNIINKYKNKDSKNPFLFPILSQDLEPKTIKNRCQRFLKIVNAHMDEVRLELGIEQKVGTYVARHSFSTTLKRKGVSTEFIKEALGHSSMNTTENYLDSFTDDVKLKFANLLTEL